MSYWCIVCSFVNAAQVYGKEKLDKPLLSKLVSERIMLYEGTRISVNFTSLSATTKSSSDLVFCLANSRADPNAVKKGLDWACGPGLANCTAIQPGQPCFEQGNLITLASFAYNDYYQKARGNGGTCNFDNTAIITTTDPSKFSSFTSELHGFIVLFVCLSDQLTVTFRIVKRNFQNHLHEQCHCYMMFELSSFVIYFL